MFSSRRTRRGLLSTVGTTVVAGLGGCAGLGSGIGGGGGDGSDGGDDSGDSDTSLSQGTIEAGDVPPYATLVPDAGGAGVVLTAFDLASDDDHTIGNVPDDPTDPLRFNGAFGAVAARVMGAFMLNLSEVDFVVERFDLNGITHYVGVDGVGAGIMPVDVNGLASDAASNDLRIPLQEGERLVFVGPQGRVFGATPGAFAFAAAASESGVPNPVERVTRVVNARAGVEPRKHEADEAFASLLRHGDTDGSVSCAYAGGGGVESFLANRSADSNAAPYHALTGGFGAASGALFHLTTRNGEAPQPASATIAYPDQGSIDAGALTATVGTAAADRSSVRDGTTVRVSGSYTWEDLEAYERGGGIGAT